MKTQHTPGPWKWSIESHDEQWAIVTNNAGSIVANVNSESGPDLPPLVSTKMPMHANARLIASAPELLKALKDAKHYLEIHADDPRTRNFISLQLNPVISKAIE